jgi:predicted Rossmann fold nucleotide-binding protein DprA/Smf involved in DNA uptake
VYTIGEFNQKKKEEELMWCTNRFGYKGLWIEGNEKVLEKNTICIAGSREPIQENALEDAFEIGSLIGKQDHNALVSGLARGVDIISLKGFFVGKRKAGYEHTPHLIGCIGTSPDSVYPKENEKLQEFLKANHLLFSLARPGTYTDKWHFLERNRLMARLSNLVIILSCTETSGCHSLLDECLLLNKKVIMSSHNKELAWVKRVTEKHTITDNYVFMDHGEIKELFDITI